MSGGSALGDRPAGSPTPDAGPSARRGSRSAVLIYPHQLFHDHPALRAAPDAPVYLVEEPLLFTQFRFHPLKIAYHRITMEAYRADVERRGHAVTVLPAEKLSAAAPAPKRGDASVGPDATDTGTVIQHLPDGVGTIRMVDPEDDWLQRRLAAACASAGISLQLLPSPAFMLSADEVHAYGQQHKRLSMAEFYKEQRRSRRVLVTSDGEPWGGRWSFDADNRKKIPKTLTPPEDPADVHGPDARTAAERTGLELPPYPVTRDDALRWLEEFLARRLTRFGDYEDAIDRRDDRWFHALLTPMLNVGLLTPDEIVTRTLAYAETSETAAPLNALEGFIRQVMGWREFMRLTYRLRGGRIRTTNFWNHTHTLPSAFYDGTTGIEPFDAVVRKTQRMAWAHHIERLMVVGNLMLLCEIDPDEVYRWFMELYIDAYDWVMVPNVYAMSQYADGGTITTKPYISGSNYLKKMSDHGAGSWQEVWDGLYWRFIDRHRAFFAGNPRLALMPKQLDKMADRRKKTIFNAADRFLTSLW